MRGMTARLARGSSTPLHPRPRRAFVPSCGTSRAGDFPPHAPWTGMINICAPRMCLSSLQRSFRAPLEPTDR